MLTNEEKKKKKSYTKGIFYFEVKLMESIMYVYREYLMPCIFIERF